MGAQYVRSSVMWLVCLCLVSLGAAPGRAAVGGGNVMKKVYVCPPCGCDGDEKVFDKAGNCPACGHALVERPGEAPARQNPAGRPAGPRNAAILLFDGVQIIDFTGPYEVLGQAFNGQKVFTVFTVAEKAGPVTTAMGMTVVPKYTLENCPETDVLVVPGGNVDPTVNNPNVLKWLRERADKAEYVMSVCNGAFILGKAGLLEGKTATTYYAMIDDLRETFPKTAVVSDQRFTDNGKIVTTAGLSSGIDGALHLVEKIAGYGIAQNVALNMEYNWRPEADYARGNFADRYLRKALGQTGFAVPAGVTFKTLKQTGDANRWEKRWWTKFDTTLPDLTRIIEAKFAEGWKKAGGRQTETSITAEWRFADEAGKPWHALSSVRLDPQDKGAYFITVSLVRADSSTESTTTRKAAN